MRVDLVAPLAMLAAMTVAQAQEFRPLDAVGMREQLVGSTITGSSTRTDMKFSEYYAPDGRILGDSGSGPVIDGCWAIRGAEMCFSYGPPQSRNTACWRPHADGTQVIFMNRANEVDFIGTIEKGNPRGHDGPRPWSCGGTAARLDMMSPRTRIE